MFVFSTLGYLESFLTEDKEPSILQNQYYSCWWPGGTRSQVISSYGIDLVYRNTPILVPGVCVTDMHVDVMTLSGQLLTWKRFSHYYPLWGKFTGRFPSQRASNAEHWCVFVGSLNMLTNSRFPVIWDAMTFLWRQCNTIIYTLQLI